MENRNIGENIRCLTDVMEYTQKSVEGLLICIDFEKAIDSLERDFLFKVLDKMNFGEGFIKCVKFLYHDITSCVRINGHVSRNFSVARRVGYGDPLSPYLFKIQ